MRHYRCLCGNSQMWSTDGAAPCKACSVCKKTLASGPSGHQDPIPHEWVKVSHGRGDDGQPLLSTACRQCHITKFQFEKEAQ